MSHRKRKSTIQKKGFTLVEMSIVLVIIGIVMGMAVKGKDMIQSSFWKKDLSRIRNLEKGYYAYTAATGRKTPTKQLNHVDYGLLVRNGYIYDNDLMPDVFEYDKNTFDLENYMTMPFTIFECSKTSMGGKEYATAMTGEPDRDVCVTIRNIKPIMGNLPVGLSAYHACMLESSLDDKDIHSGYMLINAISDASLIVKSYENCRSENKNIKFTHGLSLFI